MQIYSAHGDLIHLSLYQPTYGWWSRNMIYSHICIIIIFAGILRPSRVCHTYTIHVRDVWRRHIRVTRGRKTTSNQKLQRYAQSGAFTQQSCYWGNAIRIQNNLLPRSVWLHHKLVCFTLGFTLCFTSGFTLYSPCIRNTQRCIYMYNTQSKSYWFFNTQSRVLSIDIGR